MKEITTKKQLVGLYIFLIGIILLIKVIFPSLQLQFFLLSVLIIISINLILLSFNKKEKNKRFIIPGLILLSTSIFFILYFLIIEKYLNLKYIWPIIGFFPSISLIIYYIISNKKSPHTIIPGIFIGFLSIILLLNTSGLMMIDFISFLLILIALMFIVTGLYFIFHDKLNYLKKQPDNKSNTKEK